MRSMLMIALAVSLSLSLPIPSFAQSTDLQTTVRAALASDPRTSSMSPAQLDALSAELAAGAQAKGMTPSDITWQPIPPRAEPAPAVSGCSVFPQYFCTISDSFGFGWGDHTIPIWLLATALMFLFLAGELRAIRRRRAAARLSGDVRTVAQ